MSMKPGATTRPATSSTRSAAPARLGATATTRSPSTATSARRRGVPVPSISVPPRSRRDQAAALHDEPGHDAVERQAVVEALPRQRDEVLDGLRRVLREEFQADLVAVLERDDCRLLHGTTLIDLIRSPTRIVSTTSMPLLTCPNAVYLPFRKGAGPSM